MIDNQLSKSGLDEHYIEQHIDKLNLLYVVLSQPLSERFIDKYAHILNWRAICRSQQLTEYLIEKYLDKLDWKEISRYQHLNEKILIKYRLLIDWDIASRYQHITENVFRICETKLNLKHIVKYQDYNPQFIYSYRLVFNYLEYFKIRRKKDRHIKIEEMKAYAKKHNLVFDGKSIFVYRTHDKYGRGMFSKILQYKEGEYYKDWHCDIDSKNCCSFGIGFAPTGNTLIKIDIDDWGCTIEDHEFDWGRAYGMTVVKNLEN